MIDRIQSVALRTASKTLLVLFLGYCAMPAFGAEPTTGPLAGTTAAHNQVRQKLNNFVPPVPGAVAQPVACPSIPNVTWNDDIAAAAQVYAAKCIWAHDPDKGNVGENLSRDSVSLTGAAATIRWANEVWEDDYNYNEGGTHTCDPTNETFPLSNCGHFTQVVWAASTEIGCGVASCDAETPIGLLFGAQNLMVCRYSPPGNFDIATTRPYCTTTQTTDCEPGPGACNIGGNQLLTVAKNGIGTGTVTSNPAGIGCGDNCAFYFAEQSQVTLTAAADNGSTFDGWGGSCLGQQGNVCTLTMNAAKTVTATFTTGACAAALDLECGEPASNTTDGATADFDNYSCQDFPQNGIDVAYKLVPPQSGNVTVDLTPNGVDLDLFVLGTCDTNDCAAGSETGLNVPEQVTFAATGGQAYYVIVEDWQSDRGPFTLLATCPGGGCNGQDQHLENDTVNDTRTVHVCGTITTGLAYHVGGTGNLTLRGPQGVIFGDGFAVQQGGRMEVWNN